MEAYRTERKPHAKVLDKHNPLLLRELDVDDMMIAYIRGKEILTELQADQLQELSKTRRTPFLINALRKTPACKYHDMMVVLMDCGREDLATKLSLDDTFDQGTVEEDERVKSDLFPLLKNKKLSHQDYTALIEKLAPKNDYVNLKKRNKVLNDDVFKLMAENERINEQMKQLHDVIQHHKVMASDAEDRAKYYQKRLEESLQNNQDLMQLKKNFAEQRTKLDKEMASLKTDLANHKESRKILKKQNSDLTDQIKLLEAKLEQNNITPAHSSCALKATLAKVTQQYFSVVNTINANTHLFGGLEKGTFDTKEQLKMLKKAMNKNTQLLEKMRHGLSDIVKTLSSAEDMSSRLEVPTFSCDNCVDPDPKLPHPTHSFVGFSTPSDTRFLTVDHECLECESYIRPVSNPSDCSGTIESFHTARDSLSSQSSSIRAIPTDEFKQYSESEQNHKPLRTVDAWVNELNNNGCWREKSIPEKSISQKRPRGNSAKSSQSHRKVERPIRHVSTYPLLLPNTLPSRQSRRLSPSVPVLPPLPISPNSLVAQPTENIKITHEVLVQHVFDFPSANFSGASSARHVGGKKATCLPKIRNSYECKSSNWNSSE